jgi:hypothetical protein
MKILNKCLLLVVAFASVSGCNALKLSEANQALSNHYFAKQQSIEKLNADTDLINGGNIGMLNSMNIALSDLANDTKLQAEKESDVKSKIAFYRISATAAWQSGLLKASDYSAPGQKLCENAENRKGMDVHCGMLAFVPLFSVIDKNTDKINATQDAIKEAKAANDEAKVKALLNDIQSGFSEYELIIASAIQTKTVISNYQLSEGFIAQLDNNLRQIACTKLGRINSIISSSGLDSLANENVKKIAKLKIDLKQVVALSC